jgi:hypothetical protein
MVRYSFLVGLFHPLLQAGLSRRTLPYGRGSVRPRHLDFPRFSRPASRTVSGLLSPKDGGNYGNPEIALRVS